MNSVNYDVKYELKTKSVVLRLSMIIFIFFSIITFINKDIFQYHLIVDFYTCVVGAVLVVIGNLIGVNGNRDFIRYLTLGYIFTCILILVHIEITIQSNSLADYNLELVISYIYTYIVYCIIMFEAMIVRVAIYSFNKQVTRKRTIFYYFILLILILAIYGVLFTKVVYIYNIKFLYLNRIVFIIIMLWNISDLKKNNSKINAKEGYYLLVYIIGIALFGSVYLNGMNKYSFVLKYLMYSFRYFAYLSIFVLIEKNILVIAYNTQLVELNNAHRLNRVHNTKLRLREKLLEELESISRRSVNKSRNILDNITDGIIIFENEKLLYINPKGKKYISKLMFEGDVNIFDVYKNITGEEIDAFSITRHFNKEIKYESEKILELVSIPLEYNRIVLLIKNNTYMHKYIDMKKEYNTYIRDEEMKEEFYAIISHELRTPINVIHSALQLNEIMLKEGNYSVIKRNNKIIKSNCNRLTRTINNFIDANKITDGYLYGNKTNINIVYLIDDIVAASHKYVEKKKNTLIFDPHEEEIYVYGNIEHINRIILNLLSNALKYGQNNSEINIIAKRIINNVAIDVKYKGSKIPEEKMMYIFEKFTKLDSVLTSRSEGSGLGLFLTKKLVEQNGGSIEIVTDKDETFFRILLPVTEKAEVHITNEYSLGTITEQVDIEFSDIYF